MSSERGSITVPASVLDIVIDGGRLVWSLEILRDKWYERAGELAYEISRGASVYTVAGLAHMEEIRDMLRLHADMLDVAMQVAKEREGGSEQFVRR